MFIKTIISCRYTEPPTEPHVMHYHINGWTQFNWMLLTSKKPSKMTKCISQYCPHEPAQDQICYLLRKHIKVGARSSTHTKFRCLEAPQNVLQSCSDKEIFLLQTQLFAFKELQKIQPTELYIMWYSKPCKLNVKSMSRYNSTLQTVQLLQQAKKAIC